MRNTQSRINAAERVFDYLYARWGQWVDGIELCTPEVGGQDGIRRKRQLCENGIYIEKRRKPGSPTQYQYRMK